MVNNTSQCKRLILQNGAPRNQQSFLGEKATSGDEVVQDVLHFESAVDVPTKQGRHSSHLLADISYTAK